MVWVYSRSWGGRSSSTSGISVVVMAIGGRDIWLWGIEDSIWSVSSIVLFVAHSVILLVVIGVVFGLFSE